MERKRKLQDALDRLFIGQKKDAPSPDPSSPPPEPAAISEPKPIAKLAPDRQTAKPSAIEKPEPSGRLISSAEVTATPPDPAAPAQGIPTPKDSTPAVVAPRPASRAPSASPKTESAAASKPPAKTTATAPSPAPAANPTPVPPKSEPKEPQEATEPERKQTGSDEINPLSITSEHHLVVFALEDQYYGVDISAVEGIIKMQPITIVPRTPAYVEGVTNLRGTVLPVFDLRKRFGLASQEPTNDTRIIVIQMPGHAAGIIVDRVEEVLRIPEEKIEPPPPIASTADTSYLMGIANNNDRFVILLDLSQVLITEEKVILPTVNRLPGK